MKNVFSLSMTALVLLAACGDDGGGSSADARPPGIDAAPASPGTLTANVTVRSEAGGTLTVRQGDGVRLNVEGAQLVQEIFNPASGTYTTTEVFPAGAYTLTVDYINDFGGPAIVVDGTAQTSVQISGNTTVNVDLVVGNGFFGFNWSVEELNGTPVTSCAAIPGENGVSILSTLAGSTDAIEDLFNCEDGLENPSPVSTDPLPIGAYVVSAAILDAQGAALGVADAQNLTIPQGNDYVEAIVAIVLD